MRRALLCAALALLLSGCGLDRARVTVVDLSSMPSPTPAARLYVVNADSGVFHRPDCAALSRLSDSNVQLEEGTRAELIAMGFRPCGNCRP